MTLILTNILVIVVVNRDTSRLSALTMKARRRLISKEKGEEKLRKHT